MTSTTKEASANQTPAAAEPSTDGDALQTGALHTNIIIIGGCILSLVAVGALLYVAVIVYQRINRSKKARRHRGDAEDRLDEVDEARVHHHPTGGLSERSHSLQRRERERVLTQHPGDSCERQMLIGASQARCDMPMATSGGTNIRRHPVEGSFFTGHQEMLASPRVAAAASAASCTAFGSAVEHGELDTLVKFLRSNPQLRELLLHVIQLSDKLQHTQPPQSLHCPPAAAAAAATTAACCDCHGHEVPTGLEDSSITRVKQTAATVGRLVPGNGRSDECVGAHSGWQPHDLEPAFGAVGGLAAASSAPVAAASSDDTVATAATELTETPLAAPLMTDGTVVTVGGAAVRSPAPDVSVQDVHSPGTIIATPASGRQSPTAAATAAVLPVGTERTGVAAAPVDRHGNGNAWSPGDAACATSSRGATASAAAMNVGSQRQFCSTRRRGASTGTTAQCGCDDHQISYLKTHSTIDSSRCVASGSPCDRRLRANNLSLHGSDIQSCRVSGNGQP